MTPSPLVVELARKSGLVWVSWDGRSRAVWHEWVGDAVCVVAGGTEQQLPGLAEQRTVTLLLRSKATRALAAQVEAQVEVVEPGSEHWDTVTTALRSGRLNLVDPDHAVERWAVESVVLRLIPTGDPIVPAGMPDDLGHTAPRLVR